MNNGHVCQLLVSFAYVLAMREVPWDSYIHAEYISDRLRRTDTAAFVSTPCPELLSAPLIRQARCSDKTSTRRDIQRHAQWREMGSLVYAPDHLEQLDKCRSEL